jgi:hypothetical protein
MFGGRGGLSPKEDCGESIEDYYRRLLKEYRKNSRRTDKRNAGKIQRNTKKIADKWLQR